MVAANIGVALLNCFECYFCLDNFTVAQQRYGDAIADLLIFQNEKKSLGDSTFYLRWQ
jgi:hypothetical protein